jgi:hypothetical protein
MATTRNELEEYKHWQPEMTKLVDGKPVRFRDVCVHEIRMGDVEDPDLWVASPIWEWQQTEAGKFVMEHAVEKPYWLSGVDYTSYGTVYKIMARLSEQNETFWRLLCSPKQ